MKARKEKAKMEQQDARAGKGACQQQPGVPLEAITCRCLLFTQLSRMQLTCSFSSFQPKVAPEAALGRGSLKQLIAVCSMWIITHSPQQRVSSLPHPFTAANTENHAKDASEKKRSFEALIHHLKEPFSPLTIEEIEEAKKWIQLDRQTFYSINVGLGIYSLYRGDFFRITSAAWVAFCNILLTSTQGQRPAEGSLDQLV